MSYSQYEKVVKELRNLPRRNNAEKIAELKAQKGEIAAKILGESAARQGRSKPLGQARKDAKAKLDEINNS